MKQNKNYEIEFFSSIAKKSFEYDETTPEYQSYLKEVFTKVLPNATDLKVLEAGCGSGTFGKKILELYPTLQVTGVDITPEMVELANTRRNNLKNYNAIVGDLENKDLFDSEIFDFIICPFILHHFPTVNTVLGNLTNWLKPNGFLVILEPNGSNTVSRISKFIRHYLEFVFSKKFPIKHGWSTPNETGHTMGTYLDFLLNNYKILFSDIKYFSPKDTNIKLFSLMSFKKILSVVFGKILPLPYSGTALTIIAKKK